MNACCLSTYGRRVLLGLIWTSLAATGVKGQGTFQNLSFEQVQFVPMSPPGTGGYEWSAAVPGWAANTTSGGGVDRVYRSDEPYPLSRSLVLVGANHRSLIPRFGSYSLSLLAPSMGLTDTIHLRQFGVVPATARSLQIGFAGTPDPYVFALNGNPLTTSLVQVAPFYSVYVADVSSYAGQNVELTFSLTAPPFGARR